MSGWITDRKPSASELAVTYQPRADYEHRSGEFLVTDGVHVTLDTFELPPGTHRVTGEPYSGYWRAESSGPKWLGWMPKPSPKVWIVDEAAAVPTAVWDAVAKDFV